MILLIPPVHPNPMQLIEQFMKRNELTKVEELAPEAGCRRFRFS
jgi:hypothetical protein